MNKKELIKQGDNFLKAKLYGCNTLKKEYDFGYKIQYHKTDIVTKNLKNNTIIINNGGYFTKTTKEKINQELPNNINIFQKSYKWYIKYNGIDYNYVNGTVIKNNKIAKKYLKQNLKTNNKLKKQIKDYCNLIDNLEIIPIPANSDCWYCLFLGNKDIDNKYNHLKQHIKEKYIFGSIILNALKEAGYKVPQIFFITSDINKAIIKKALYKYLIKKLA